jgi:hypothetical protein
MQLAGIFSYAGGETKGFQGSGMFGIGSGFSGGQITGIGGVNFGNFRGSQISGIGAINTGDVKGFQLAGIFNFSSGNMDGFQLAGITNWTGGSLNGLQMGLVNFSGEGGTGVQIGLVNLSRNGKIIPIGLVNIVDGGILNPSAWIDSMGFMNLSLKSGSTYFYSHLSAGIRGIPLGNTRLAFMGRHDDNLFVSRFGLGGEIPLESLFFNIEVLCGSIIKTAALGNNMAENTFLIQGRLIGGFKLLSRLAFFAGLSYDYLLPFNSSSPVPRGGIRLGWSDDGNIHRIGFFGGLQF